MIRRGKHAAPRPKGRETRRFGRAVPLALALVMVMSAVAWAGHSSTVSFSKNPANTGDKVDVTATAHGSHDSPPGSGNLRLDICQVQNEDLTWGPYAPAEDCNGSVGGAVWRDWDSKSTTGNDTLTKEFDTETTEVTHVGFRSRYTPDQGHSTTATANLQIIYPTSGSHAGCNGIENAYDQVTTNNGAVKGKGNSANALQKVADKLGCGTLGE